MKKGGGKAKGSHFERVIAKKIGQAYKKYGIHQSECWRSILSGGHHWAKGDLVLSERLSKMFPFVVECKNQKGWKLHRFFEPLGKVSLEAKWMRQVIRAAGGQKKLHPMLVMTQNRVPVFCVVPWKLVEGAVEAVGLNGFRFHFDRRVWWIGLFEDFLRWIADEPE